MAANNILIGAGFIGVGALMMALGIRKNKRCSSRIVGRITGVHEDMETDDEGYHSYSYTPEYEYEVNGKVYHGSGGRAYAKRKKIQIGGSIDIYYNPDKPDEHYTKGSGNTMQVLGIAVMFLGVIYIVGTLF